MSRMSSPDMRGAIASRLPGIGSALNFTGWHITGAGLMLVILLTLVLVLAWGDTLSFPKVLNKEIPTQLISLSADSQDDLGRGIIPSDIRNALGAEGASISDGAGVSTVVEGQEWWIIDPHQEFVVVTQGDALSVGGDLLSAGSALYLEDLGQETIPENVREEFRLKGMGLSDSAKVSTLGEGRGWLITDPRKKYSVIKQHFLNVGDVAVVVDPITETELNTGAISENLKSEFRRQEIPLSDGATVSTLEAGNSWLIVDPNLAATHTVTRGEDQLNIDEIEDKEIFLNEDIAGGVDFATKYVTTEGEVVFDFIGYVIKTVLTWIEDALLWLPYPVLIGGVGLLAWRTASIGVGLFSIGSLLMIGFVGLWPSAMETLSLMLTAVAISTLIAIPIGIVAARNNGVDAGLRPLLDGMQTMPSFVYLVPAIFFFGLGNVPAVIATIIYAVPPAIRLTNLGIRQVSPETLEAARAFGATPLQLLVKVQMPLALPTIMAGINQTTMMALAMVVVASLVGAGGLGADVLKAIGRLQTGNSLLAGMSIVFLAIIIDRITQGFAAAQARATQE